MPRATVYGTMCSKSDGFVNANLDKDDGVLITDLVNDVIPVFSYEDLGFYLQNISIDDSIYNFKKQFQETRFLLNRVKNLDSYNQVVDKFNWFGENEFEISSLESPILLINNDNSGQF